MQYIAIRPRHTMSSRGIPFSDAAAIKSAIPPGDFYRRELPTMKESGRRAGWMDGGLCPFHDDHRPGSFRINLETGAYRCFAPHCDAHGGDIIAFVRRRYNLDYAGALGWLATNLGVRP